MSIGLILEMAASGFPERTALGSGADGLTYAELQRRAQLVAGHISATGAKHVVFLGRNGPAYPVLLFSSALAGVPFVPVNYRLAREAVLDLVAEVEEPLVVADADYLALVEGRHAALLTDEVLGGRLDPAPPSEPAVSDDDPAVLLFTSGTTARPKAVVLRHANLLAYIFSTVDFGAADEREAALVSVPPYHVAAIGSALSSAYAGRRVVYLPDFDPVEWLELVRRERVSSAMVVPTMLARIVDALGSQRGAAPDLRLLSYGGARMPRPVLVKALQAFPDTGFCNAYGLTETSSTLTLLGPEDHREALDSVDPKVRARLGSAGRAVPGVDLQVRDPAGTPVAAGLVGDLYVRGAQVSGEYREQGSVLDQDGWFDTRDRAWIDEDGYVFIEGRTDDTIIRGGENVAPAEIEDVLREHPVVKDVAVIGAPDEEWGERIVAVVVRTGDAPVTEGELREFVRARLRGSRTPDDVIWRAELPHTATGKLLRRQLVAELTEGP